LSLLLHIYKVIRVKSVVFFIAALTWKENTFPNRRTVWPRDMTLNVSCKMNDPTVKVYVVIIASSITKEFRDVTEQVVHMKTDGMEHFIVQYDVQCYAISPALGEAVPTPFLKGKVHISSSKFIKNSL